MTSQLRSKWACTGKLSNWTRRPSIWQGLHLLLIWMWLPIAHMHVLLCDCDQLREQLKVHTWQGECRSCSSKWHLHTCTPHLDSLNAARMRILTNEPERPDGLKLSGASWAWGSACISPACACMGLPTVPCMWACRACNCAAVALVGRHHHVDVALVTLIGDRDADWCLQSPSLLMGGIRACLCTIWACRTMPKAWFNTYEHFRLHASGRCMVRTRNTKPVSQNFTKAFGKRQCCMSIRLARVLNGADQGH